MKNYLQTIVLLIFIVVSCKQKEESKVEKTKEISKINIDNTNAVKKVETEITKEVAEYKTVKKPKIKESDYIDFLNSVLNSGGLMTNKKIGVFKMNPDFWNDFLISLTEKSKDSLKSEIIDLNDIKFIYEQAEIKSKYELSSDKINLKKISKNHLKSLSVKYTDLDKYWEEVYKLGNGYYSLELPLFSIDKEIAIFRYSYSCGSLCANTGTYVYRKINGKWKLIGNIGGEIVS